MDREQMNQAMLQAKDSCDHMKSPEVRVSLRQQAFEIARKATYEAGRFDRLAERLTPEIETAIDCFRECVALGLIPRSER